MAAIEARNAKAYPEQPDGPVVEGFAHQLRKGDFVVAIGGTHLGVSYKRWRIGDFVVEAGQTKRQRTRGHVVFAGLGDYTMNTWYPVRYVRAEA